MMSTTNRYVRFTRGVNDRGSLIKPEEVFNFTQDNSRDYYTSIYYYTEEHKAKFIKNGTISGLNDLKTDKIVFDFDSSDNPEIARADTIEVIKRLNTYGITDKEIEIYFSGKKGYHVLVSLNRELTPVQVASLCINKFGKDLSTLDTKIYNASRLFRIPGTRNLSTGLFKIPITVEQIKTLNTDQIKLIAKSLDNIKDDFNWEVASPDASFFNVPEPERKKVEPVTSKELEDLPLKPKFLDQARWTLSNGFFKEGDRSHALLCLGSTYKSLGYPEEITYRILKGVAEIQAKRNNMDRFPDTELYNNIVMQIYGPNWRGGTYSTKDPESWLYQYCQKMGIKDKDDCEYKPMKIHEISDGFLQYIDNFENNRIYFGLDDLDKTFPLCAGSAVAILAPPSAGKTALALKLLANTSQNNNLSVFASLDMSRNRLFEKILYRQFNKTREDTFQTFKDKKDWVKSEIQKEFSNVYIYDRSTPSINNIRDYIVDIEQTTGDTVKLVVIDYFERINSDKSEDTAASKQIAGEIQNLANDFPNMCVVVLVQPSKHAIGGGPDELITSYTAIKGSSFMAQAFRQIIALCRPFFNPQSTSDDKYMQIAILKNDLGELGVFNYGWEGRTGSIYQLEELQKNELKELLKQKALNKNNSEGWG